MADLYEVMRGTPSSRRFADEPVPSVGYRAEPWPKRLSLNPVSEFAFGERYGGPW